MDREEILKIATKLHDELGCRCDRKYLMSCPRLAQAILEIGKREEQASRPPDMVS